MMRRLATLALAGAVLIAPAARAAEGEIHIARQDWSFGGLFGTFDRAAAQRGYKVFHEVCSNCHSAHLLSFRNLADLGLSDAQVRALAAQVEVTDGPNDEGEMFQRPGRPSDRFPKRFPNDQAARAANNGALPPDLSLIIKAREGGADYVYALLTGYTDPPPGVQVMEGMNYNAAFPGHQIGMARPLNDDQVEYTDGTPTNTAQLAHDVVTFLAWAAEPEMEVRKAMGVKIILFLLVMTGLTYAVKRKVWADVHH